MRPVPRSVAVRAFVALVLVACGGKVQGDADADATPDAEPPLPGLRVVAIAADTKRACAVREDGRLYCWDAYGPVDRAVPTEVPDLPPVASVTLVESHACATTIEGSVLCWGDVLHLPEKGTRPVPVPLGGPVHETACANHHCCAVRRDGTVSCWGSNDNLQLGAPAATKESRTPLPVALGGRAVAVVAGYEVSCAKLADGTVWCWGSSAFGAQGTGEDADGAPAAVPGLSGVVELRAGANTVCAIGASNRVLCWGTDPSFQIRGNLGGLAYVPSTIDGFDQMRDIAPQAAHNCGLQADGLAVQCYGGVSRFTGRERGPIGTIARLPRRSTRIALSPHKVFALDDRGVVMSWGADITDRGTSGTGTDVPTRIPVPR